MNAAPALSHAPPRGGWILGLLWLAFLAVGAARLPAFDAGHMTRLWDVNEGLPQSSVTDIARTADGFLWVGTLHSGLARFDGLRFECHDLTTTPQLGHAGIRRLLADKPGRLWVNTYAPDLLLLEDGRFTRIMAQSPQIENLLASSRDMALFNLPENHLLRIRRGKDGVWHGEKVMNSTENPIHTWVGGADGTAWYRRQNGIIGRFENGRFVDLPSIPGFDEARASSLQADRDGRVWLTNGNRFCGWNGRMFEEASPEGAESIAGLVRIAPAGAAGVWVETAKQLRLCRDRRWIAEAKGWDPQTYGPPIGRARRIDDEGGLWIHVTNLGLVHIRADGRLSRITVADGLDSSAISCMVPDGHGGLWTGYPRGGLVNVRPRLFDTINRRDGLNDLLVSSVCEDAEGAIWIGSAGGNLSRWSDGRISTFTLPLLGNRCHTPLVAAAPDGRLWIATDGNGLWVRENQGFRNVIAPEELSGAPRALLVDRSGQVWIATFNGVFRMKGEVMETVQQIHGAGAYPGAIAEAPDGAVWIGTLGGELIRFQENGMKRIRLPGSGPRNFISALHADDDGSLWIGTQGGGLLYWHKGKFSRFTSADGLPGDRIWELLDDGLGCLWLGPGTGIARLDKAQIKNAASKGGHLTALRFGEGDGLDAASGTPELKPSCHRARDGTLWFASARGVINVDPSRVRPPGAPPATWIERVAVNGAGVDATKPLVVGPGSKSLDFTYTAPEFGHPSLIRYRHKLSGLDDGWIYAGQDRIANYRHVPPGKYEFLVSASNAAGQWAHTPPRFG